MVTLYHFNHSCNDCVPGIIFDLFPFPSQPVGKHPDDYDFFKSEFPAGLSVFGWRHFMPYLSLELAPPLKRKMEWECELFRRKSFGHKPSRYQAFFAVDSLDDAITFAKDTKAETGKSGSIWEVEAERVAHRGDMRLLIPERYDETSMNAYWLGTPLEGGTPVWECLVIPPIKMVRCVIQGDASVATT